MRPFDHHRVAFASACLAIGSIAVIGCGQPAPGQPAAPASAPAGASQRAVDRGKYLVSIMDCNGCHTPFKDGQPDMSRMLMGHPENVRVTAPPPPPAAGGWLVTINETNTAWAGPWGVSFPANLTPDQNSGLGIWTEEMFVNAIRKGKHMGTSRDVLPPMPWMSYNALTDDDLKAIYAYLRTIPAISNHVPEPISPAAPPKTAAVVQ